MAKSSRSSAKKHNHQRLAATVFGPAESARAERLSARLLEVAKQGKPESSDVNMVAEPEEAAPAHDEKKAKDEDATTMEVDSSSKPSSSSRIINRHRINKRQQKKSKIVFRKYSDNKKATKGGK